MKTFLIKTLQILFAFGLAAFIIWWSIHELTAQDKADIQQAFTNASYIYVIPVIILLFISNCLRAGRWQQIIAPLGAKPPFKDLLFGIMLGYAANQFIPRAGELLRCTVIAKKHPVTVAQLVGTVIIERSLDLLCFAILAIIVFFIEYAQIHAYAIEVLQGVALKWQNNSSPLVILGYLCIFMLLFAAYRFLKKRYSQKQFFLFKIFRGIAEGLASIKHIPNKPLFIIQTILLWVVYILATWLGCFAFTETAHLSIGTAMVLLVSGTLGIIIAPGGLGAYPYAIQKTLVLYGITKNIGLAFGWLLWMVQFLFTITFGIIAFIVLNSKTKAHAQHNHYTTKNT